MIHVVGDSMVGASAVCYKLCYSAWAVSGVKRNAIVSGWRRRNATTHQGLRRCQRSRLLSDLSIGRINKSHPQPGSFAMSSGLQGS